MCLRDLFQISAQLKYIGILTFIFVHRIDVSRTVRPIHIVRPIPVTDVISRGAAYILDTE